MLTPTKYENINRNLLVMGAEAIAFLKKKPYNLEALYQKLNMEMGISIEQYFDTLTFLWISGILLLDDFQLNLKRDNL